MRQMLGIQKALAHLLGTTDGSIHNALLGPGQPLAGGPRLTRTQEYGRSTGPREWLTNDRMWHPEC